MCAIFKKHIKWKLAEIDRSEVMNRSLEEMGVLIPCGLKRLRNSLQTTAAGGNNWFSCSTV